MKFCPKCGTTLIPTKNAKKVILTCQKCGYRTGKAERDIDVMRPLKETIVVIGKEEQKIGTLPKTNIGCPKCGNLEAYYWLVQTRGGDEASTQFFRCVRCGTTWRETS